MNEVRRLFFRFVAFCIPISMLLGGLEYATRKLPNNYEAKERFLFAHKDDIESLILGNSQAYMGVNPAEFPSPAYNLANTAQTLRYDWEMFNKYAGHLPNLQRVYVGISYPSLFISASSMPGDFNRAYHYWHFLDIKGEANPFSFKYWSMINVYTIKRSVDRIYDHYFHDDPLIEFDSLGWYTDPHQRDLAQNARDAGSFHHQNMKMEYCSENLAYLSKVIGLCKQKRIDVILFSPPLYNNYQEQMKEGFLKKMRGALDSISKAEQVYYLDATNSDIFTADDFFDSNHLGKSGAQKFTQDLLKFIDLTD